MGVSRILRSSKNQLMRAPMRLQRGHGENFQMPTDFELREMILEPGDALVAYSDGVLECRNTLEEEFGLDWILATLRQLRIGIGTDAREMRASDSTCWILKESMNYN
jgi:hypothetical protein